MKNKKKNVFIKIFNGLFRFFDNTLITPLTKSFLRMIIFTKDKLKLLDGIAGKKSTLIIISLILSFITFLVIDGDSRTMVDKYAETLYKQKVNVIYNEELYVVDGIPSTVDVTLIGQKRHIFLAKQAPNQGITIDLTGLRPGNHRVDLVYPKRLRAIDYNLSPSSASVSIYEKVSENKPLSYDLLHQDNLNTRFSINKVKLDRSEVIVKGPKYRLDQVATVKALVDIDELPKQEEGIVNLENVPLVAYDSNGKVVNVETVPANVNVSVEINSPHKTIPINVIPKGDLAFGKSIKSIDIDIKEVTIYGNQSAINKLEVLEVPIDVKGLNKDKTYHVTLDRPNGVTEIDTKTLDIRVILDNSSTKELNDIPIRIENLDSKYKAQAKSEDDSMVDVVIYGSSDALVNITADNVKPYVNLKNYGQGEHEVEVKVTGSDNKLKYSSKTKKVKIIITNK